MIGTVGEFFRVLDALDVIEGVFKEHPDLSSDVEEKDRDLVMMMANTCRQVLEKHGFVDIEKQALHLEETAKSKWQALNYYGLLERVGLLKSMFRVATLERQVYVFREGDSTYTTSAGFGDEIKRAFPSALPEIDASGRCYALEEFTAGVFHLMRAVEHLLRVFVVAVGVPQSGRPIPLDYQQWEALINSAESLIRPALRSSWSNRPAMSKARDILTVSIADFYSFKDNVRNHLMHTRSGLVSEPIAHGVLGRVKDCFQRLVPYVSEHSKGALLDQAFWAAHV